jgi:hypothetical protein
VIAVDLTIVATLSSMVYAIWVRRGTFSSEIERPLTVSIALGIVGIALVSPQGSSITGAGLHALTGQWHLETCSGDFCLIASQISAHYWLLGGVFNDGERKIWMRYRVQPVVTLAMPHMAACMALTRAVHEGTPNILDAAPDAWLTGYWLIVAAMMIYIWVAGLCVLRVMRRDRDSRHVANAYIATMGCGIAACTLQIVSVLSGIQQPVHGLFTWWLLCSGSAGTCLVAAWSWRLKQQRLRGNLSGSS